MRPEKQGHPPCPRRAVLRFFCFSRVGRSRIRRILAGRHDAAVGGDGRGRSTLAKPAGRSRWTSGMPARTMGGQTRGALARVGLRVGRLMAPGSPCADTAEVLLDRNRRAIDARRLAAACTQRARAAWTRDRVYGQLCMQLYNHGKVRCGESNRKLRPCGKGAPPGGGGSAIHPPTVGGGPRRTRHHCRSCRVAACCSCC